MPVGSISSGAGPADWSCDRVRAGGWTWRRWGAALATDCPQG